MSIITFLGINIVFLIKHFSTIVFIVMWLMVGFISWGIMFCEIFFHWFDFVVTCLCNKRSKFVFHLSRLLSPNQAKFPCWVAFLYVYTQTHITILTVKNVAWISWGIFLPKSELGVLSIFQCVYSTKSYEHALWPGITQNLVSSY